MRSARTLAPDDTEPDAAPGSPVPVSRTLLARPTTRIIVGVVGHRQALTRLDHHPGRSPAMARQQLCFVTGSLSPLAVARALRVGTMAPSDAVTTTGSVRAVVLTLETIGRLLTRRSIDRLPVDAACAFSSAEVFRILPRHGHVVPSLCTADLIGFHTWACVQPFWMSLVHIDGFEIDLDSVQVGASRVQLGVYPMGVDVAAFEPRARNSRVQNDVTTIRGAAGDGRVVLGIEGRDRYTKGMPRRLTDDPTLRDGIRDVQIPASRGMVDSHRAFTDQVEATVGRINGTGGTLGATQVHYVYALVSQEQLAERYSAADVMLITPLRDGMDFVGKEFLATRANGDAPLALRELAAAEVGEALVVDEPRRRIERLRASVPNSEVHHWAGQSVSALQSENRPAVPQAVLEDPWSQLSLFERAERVVLLLDYDGTLVPLAPLPHMAVPDRELKDLLRMLAMAPGVALHLVSGRPRESLAEWFDEVPLTLWAEHAFWHRPLGGDWQPAAPFSTDWMAGVTPILEQFTATTPGSLVEKKSVSLAWHYRQAERELGSRQAQQLLMVLGDTLSNQPLEVLKGHKVIEVRCRGMNKAAVAHALPSHTEPAILAAGDDRTDEDLFGALPASAVTICVGPRPSGARCRLADYRAVRRLLAGVLASRTRRGADRAGSKTGR